MAVVNPSYRTIKEKLESIILKVINENPQDISGKENTSNKVTSISSSSTDTQYPSAKLVYDELDNKLNSKVKATTTFSPQTYESGTNWNWTTPFKVTITNNGNLTLDFSPMFDKDDDRVYFNITTNQEISVHYDDTTLYTSTDTKSMYIIKTNNNYILHLYNSDNFSNFDNYYTKTNPIITIGTTTLNSTEISFGNKMWYHYVSYIDRVYPIGSIYMSVNSVDPTYFIGGTWERIEDRFLLASGSTYSAGSTGGSANATLVSHNHATNTNGEYFVTSENSEANNTRVSYNASGNRYVDGMTTSSTPFHHRVETGYSGVSGTGKNMPPYLTVYMWKRIG